jgi:hypothetical protein
MLPAPFFLGKALKNVRLCVKLLLTLGTHAESLIGPFWEWGEDADRAETAGGQHRAAGLVLLCKWTQYMSSGMGEVKT